MKTQKQIYQQMENLTKDEDYWVKTEYKQFYEASYKILLDLVKQVPHKKILEVGCAQGYFTKQLSQIADEVVAIDVSESELKRAKEHNKDSTNVAFYHLPLEDFSTDEVFDVIICSEVLYYILDKEKALNKLQSLGKYLIASNFIFCWPYASIRGLLYEIALQRFPLIKRVFQTNKRPLCLDVKSLRKLG